MNIYSEYSTGYPDITSEALFIALLIMQECGVGFEVQNPQTSNEINFLFNSI
jgi:hypothetical protein